MNYNPHMPSEFKRIVLWTVIVMMAIMLWTVLRYYGLAHLPREITYSRFLDEVRAKQVSKIKIRRHTEVSGIYRDTQRGHFYTWVPANDPDLYRLLSANGVETEVDESLSLDLDRSMASCSNLHALLSAIPISAT